MRSSFTAASAVRALEALLSVLGEDLQVQAPSMPGFDESDRPEWARSGRGPCGNRVAHLLSPERRFANLGRAWAGGMGGGGDGRYVPPSHPSLDTRFAARRPQPKVGDIFDPFLVSTERYLELSFASTDAYKRTFGGTYEIGSDAWLRREGNREMTTRIAWRPRMFDSTLPFRLPYITTPTLILWGEAGDQILPRAAVEYKDSIPNVDLVTLSECGHMPECEAPGKVSAEILSFVGRI